MRKSTRSKSRRRSLLSALRPRLVHDSSGKPSWTHTLAVPFACLTMAKWLLAGFSVHAERFSLAVPDMTASDCVMVLSVWLAFLGQRDWAERKYNQTEAETEPATPPSPPRG